VAKEYVAASPDLDGALVLSPFTGAARELEPAWIVSPYDQEGMADALAQALDTPRLVPLNAYSAKFHACKAGSHVTPIGPGVPSFRSQTSKLALERSESGITPVSTPAQENVP